MAEYVVIEGITRTERHEAIERVKEALLASGGFITDAQLFSNKAVRLSIEIPAGALPRLASALHDAHIALLGEGDGPLVALASRLPADREVLGSISLTFVHDEPDLRIKLPAVPG